MIAPQQGSANMDDKPNPILDYETPASVTEHRRHSVSNQQARLISCAIVLSGGMLAGATTGMHGDPTPFIVTAIGLIVFVIEFIRSYRLP
jgi:hypothetical protein